MMRTIIGMLLGLGLLACAVGFVAVAVVAGSFLWYNENGPAGTGPTPAPARRAPMSENDSNEETVLSKAERELLIRFLDELGNYQSNAGCNDIELANTAENVEMVREVLAHPDYADDEYYDTWDPGLRASFYAPCQDWGLTAHLRRRLKAGAS